MASVGSVNVGVEFVEPPWQAMVIALTNHSMRALGHLEADRPDLALASLKLAESVGEMAMMIRHDPCGEDCR